MSVELHPVNTVPANIMHAVITNALNLIFFKNITITSLYNRNTISSKYHIHMENHTVKLHKYPDLD